MIFHFFLFTLWYSLFLHCTYSTPVIFVGTKIWEDSSSLKWVFSALLHGAIVWASWGKFRDGVKRAVFLWGAASYSNLINEGGGVWKSFQQRKSFSARSLKSPASSKGQNSDAILTPSLAHSSSYCCSSVCTLSCRLHSASLTVIMWLSFPLSFKITALQALLDFYVI